MQNARLVRVTKHCGCTHMTSAASVCDQHPLARRVWTLCMCKIYIIVFVCLAVRFNTLIHPRGPVFVWSLNGGLVSATQAWLNELNQTIRVLSPEEASHHLLLRYALRHGGSANHSNLWIRWI